MRTTLNLSENIIKETQKLYNTTNRSNAVKMPYAIKKCKIL